MPRPANLGPSSLSSQLTAMSQITPAQRTMLGTLSQIGHAATISQISKLAGLHANSARETLDALVEAGLVVRTATTPKGRGRPAWSYEITAPDIVNGFQRQVSDLIVAMAKFIKANSANPMAKAVEFGRQWADQFINADKAGSLPPTEGLVQFQNLDLDAYISQIRVSLSTQGFQATAGQTPNQIELHSCPFLVDDPNLQKLVCTIHGSMFAHVVNHISGGKVKTVLCPLVSADSCRVVLDFKSSTTEKD